MDRSLFVTTPRGLESMLAGELKQLGGRRVRQVPAGASCEGSLETAYRLCLWSRLASRVLLPLTTGPATSADELYATARRVRWDDHVRVDGTLAVDFGGASDAIRDARFGAVRVKDAIVDQLRDAHGGRRPSVDVRHPDLRVNARLARGRVTISLDLSGDGLHRRGYRAERPAVTAPLKENLAAALLLFAAWPQEAAAGGGFVDPLCGSATLPIEAAFMAADIAPGLLRAERTSEGRFALERWRGHDGGVWERLVAEAKARREAGLGRLQAAQPGLRVLASDHDPRAVRAARAGVARAGLARTIAVRQADLRDVRPPAAHGLLVANAPYGERLGSREEAEALSRALGDRLRAAFDGWHAAVLAGGREQIAALGLPVIREMGLFNGRIPCTLAYVEVRTARTAAPRGARAAARSSAHGGAASARNDAVPARRDEPTAQPEPSAPPRAGPGPRPGALLSGGAEHFANRLRKNLRTLRRQLRREDISCYRLYDADLPDYNVVVDVYGEWVHVQEYAAPPEIDPAKARRRLGDALAVIAATLEVPPARVVLKERRRQRGAAQYERRAAGGTFLTVREDGLAYLVDLHSYLDTGLFIDQRLTRRLVRRLAAGRRFLNLFGYTGTMTVNALAGGAPESTTVDLSSTYLRWAAQNLKANGFAAELAQAPSSRHPEPDTHQPAPHLLVRADCLRWLAEAEGDYDLIWLEPPTFSNSRRMGRATFDVQRDHADLVRMTARRLLAPGGILLFSTNRRGFRLHREVAEALSVKDLSRETLPFDCSRSAARHHVLRCEHKGR